MGARPVPASEEAHPPVQGAGRAPRDGLRRKGQAAVPRVRARGRRVRHVSLQGVAGARPAGRDGETEAADPRGGESRRGRGPRPRRRRAGGREGDRAEEEGAADEVQDARAALRGELRGGALVNHPRVEVSRSHGLRDPRRRAQRHAAGRQVPRVPPEPAAEAPEVRFAARVARAGRERAAGSTARAAATRLEDGLHAAQLELPAHPVLHRSVRQGAQRIPGHRVADSKVERHDRRGGLGHLQHRLGAARGPKMRRPDGQAAPHRHRRVLRSDGDEADRPAPESGPEVPVHRTVVEKSRGGRRVDRHGGVAVARGLLQPLGEAHM